MQGAWMSVLGGCRSEDIQDLGYELPRIPIPRTRVNKGKRYRAEAALDPCPLI